MKNKQKRVLIFTFAALLFSVTLHAQSRFSLNKADSLFTKKQYTQSLDLYEDILSRKQYSPSMLMKMAFIEEGLGHLSQSLYYLNLYYLASADEDALAKMEEIAAKNHLQGYKADETRLIEFTLRENYAAIIKIIGGALFLLFALMFYQKFKQGKRPLAAAILILLLTACLFLHVNFSKETSRAIVFQPATYLMSGPSAGASVVSIIGEGHQLDVLDRKDVWVHVKWMGKDAYLRESQIKMIQL